MEDNQLVTAKVASETLATNTDLPENKLITYGELMTIMNNMEVIPLNLVTALGGGIDACAIFKNFRNDGVGYVGLESNGYVNEYDMQQGRCAWISTLRYDEMDGQNFIIRCESGFSTVDTYVYTSDDGNGAEYYSLSRDSSGNIYEVKLKNPHNSVIFIVEIYS